MPRPMESGLLWLSNHHATAAAWKSASRMWTALKADAASLGGISPAVGRKQTIQRETFSKVKPPAMKKESADWTADWTTAGLSRKDECASMSLVKRSGQKKKALAKACKSLP